MDTNKSDLISIEDFLVSIPPGNLRSTKVTVFPYNTYSTLLLNNIELYCSNEKCDGIRFFKTESSLKLTIGKTSSNFLTYKCKNCGESPKIYALLLTLKTNYECDVYKLGEIPQFGPPLPTRIFKLIGEDKELFLKGRRSENQGLGIGAFSYYRRVVENQKNRIFDEIIKALEDTKASKDLIEQLKMAKKEVQFTNAIESIKTALPDILLISGHNPLNLLHKALSEGIHLESEKDCLELATSIRTVLSELSERISHIIKDKKEINAAVVNILNRKNKK